MMNSKKQQGMTMISMLALAVLIGFVLLIAIKLAPVYLGQFKVASALKGLTSDARAKDASSDDIKELLLKKFQIDDVDHIKAEDIKIDTQGSAMIVRIDYEARVNILSNVDAVVVFDGNEVRLGN